MCRNLGFNTKRLNDHFLSPLTLVVPMYLLGLQYPLSEILISSVSRDKSEKRPPFEACPLIRDQLEKTVGLR